VNRLRVHVVDFINAWPLAAGLRRPAAGLEVSWGAPSECADALAGGEADVGLIPSAAYARIPGLRILPGLSISCRGPVASVLLLARKPWKQVRRVALDAGSRTSAELARLVLGWEGLRPEAAARPPDLGRMLEGADAALLIGDRALKADTRGLRVLDLGEAWFRHTGLPFVFAFWAVREGVALADGGEAFHRSAAEGAASLEALAGEGARREGLDEGRVLDYLRRNVRYGLGDEEKAGLERFFAEMHGAGRIREVPPLRFLEPEEVHP